MNFAPYFWNERDGTQISSHVKPLYMVEAPHTTLVISVLNSFTILLVV